MKCPLCRSSIVDVKVIKSGLALGYNKEYIIEEEREDASTLWRKFKKILAYYASILHALALFTNDEVIMI